MAYYNAGRVLHLCSVCSRKWAMSFKGTYLCGYCIADAKAKAKTKGRFDHLIERARKDPAYGKREYKIVIDG